MITESSISEWLPKNPRMITERSRNDDRTTTKLSPNHHLTISKWLPNDHRVITEWFYEWLPNEHRMITEWSTNDHQIITESSINDSRMITERPQNDCRMITKRSPNDYRMAYTSPPFVQRRPRHSPIQDKTQSAVMMTFVLALSVGIAISILLFWHIYLIYTAQTTKIRLTEPGRDSGERWGDAAIGKRFATERFNKQWWQLTFHLLTSRSCLLVSSISNESKQSMYRDKTGLSR